MLNFTLLPDAISRDMFTAGSLIPDEIIIEWLVIITVIAVENACGRKIWSF